MKKVLFATTAIVAFAAAGVAAANDVKLSVGGYQRIGVGVGQYDPVWAGGAIEKDFVLIHDGEIHFKGKGSLDNGIEITTRIELEAFSTDGVGPKGHFGDQIDENYVQVASQLGKLLIGGNDDAAYNVGYVGITGVTIGMSNLDTTYEFSPVSLGTIGGRDAYGIHYYTPKIFGLELGVSYQPDLSDPNIGYKSTAAVTDSERVAFGAAYSNSFGDVDFTIGGGYVYSAAGNNTAATGTDTNQWGVGVNIATHGFGVDFRYEAQDQNGTAGDHTRLGAGVTYATGPWTFGLAGAMQDNSGTGANDPYVVMGGVQYALGNGVAAGAGVSYGDTDAGTEGFGGAVLLGINF